MCKRWCRIWRLLATPPAVTKAIESAYAGGGGQQSNRQCFLIGYRSQPHHTRYPYFPAFSQGAARIGFVFRFILRFRRFALC